MSSFGVLRLPQTIHFGYGARACLQNAVSAFGERIFILVDPFLRSSPNFIEATEAMSAAGATVSVYSEIQPELPADSLHDVADIARDFAPDAVIGWGGGSVLDAAKLIALLVSHRGELADYYGEHRVPGKVLPLICVPTTAGTGSEATPVAVVSDPDRVLKVGISSPYLIPNVAIVDPELTLGVPATVTAHSGIDALAHAVESYTAIELNPTFEQTLPVFVGRNAIGEALCLEAIRLIGPTLEVAVKEPTNRDAREAMAKGSLIAGMTFGNTGTHLAHAIQYPLGALTKTPHGLGTGMMLPYVLEACAPAIQDRLTSIATALDAGSTPADAIDRIAEIVENIGIPRSIQDIGVTRDDIADIAKLTFASTRLTDISPIPADVALVTRILEAAYAGDRTLLRP